MSSQNDTFTVKTSRRRHRCRIRPEPYTVDLLPAHSSRVSWCLCRISARPLCVTLMMFSSLSAEEAPGWRSLPALSVRWISLLHDPGPREPLQPLPRQRSSHTQRQDGKTTFSHAPCSLMHSKVSDHLNKMYNPENRSVAEGQTTTAVRTTVGSAELLAVCLVKLNWCGWAEVYETLTSCRLTRSQA